MAKDKPLVAIAQISPILGELESNADKHLREIEYAKELGASLIVFPELSLTGYLLKDLTADVAQRVGESEILKLLE
ncbi:MAG TPA: nitrilase-related carbon-nitrogen hydrolase, partial [Acidobacteriota bacterium]|nr:nitrilase-related carbon-nitrogen hydrolase [Acidobacteriota bacterium]